MLFPVSIEVDLIAPSKNEYRTRLDSLVHGSSRTAQKDWERSASAMKKTALASEVFPPTDVSVLLQKHRRAHRRAAVLRAVGLRAQNPLPLGYAGHAETIAKYREHDGFVHVAQDARHPR